MKKKARSPNEQVRKLREAIKKDPNYSTPKQKALYRARMNRRSAKNQGRRVK